METFSALLVLCAGNSPVTGEFPTQRPVTRSFDVFFDLRLNNGLSKQSWGWWFEAPSHPLWRHCNGTCRTDISRARYTYDIDILIWNCYYIYTCEPRLILITIAHTALMPWKHFLHYRSFVLCCHHKGQQDWCRCLLCCEPGQVVKQTVERPVADFFRSGPLC